MSLAYFPVFSALLSLSPARHRRGPVAEGIPAAICETSDLDMAMGGIDRAAALYRIVTAEWWHLVQERELAAAVRKLADVRRALDMTDEAAQRAVWRSSERTVTAVVPRRKRVLTTLCADMESLAARFGGLSPTSSTEQPDREKKAPRALPAFTARPLSALLAVKKKDAYTRGRYEFNERETSTPPSGIFFASERLVWR